MPDKDHLTLAEVTRRFVASRIAEDLLRKNALADMLAMGIVPLSQRPWHQRWPVILRRRLVTPVGTLLIKAGIALGGDNPSDYY